MGRRFLFLTAIMLPLLSVNVCAYDQAGHYYTVRAALSPSARYVPTQPSDSAANSNLLPLWNSQEVALISFCTQLPDIAVDLDAIAPIREPSTLAFLFDASRHALGGYVADPGDPGWIDWLFSDSELIRRVLSLHMMLHALTGQSYEATHRAAKQIVRRLQDVARTTRSAEDMCALGLAYHLLGDSEAHRKLGDPSKMYKPILGHLMAAHKPDFFWLKTCDSWEDRLFMRHGCRDGENHRTIQRYTFWNEYLGEIDSVEAASEQPGSVLSGYLALPDLGSLGALLRTENVGNSIYQITHDEDGNVVVRFIRRVERTLF